MGWVRRGSGVRSTIVLLMTVALAAAPGCGSGEDEPLADPTVPPTTARPTSTEAPTSSQQRATTTVPISLALAELLDKLKREQVPTARASEVVSAPSNVTDPVERMRRFVDFVLMDADKMWSDVFKRLGFKEPFWTPVYLAPGQTYTTTCTDTNNRRIVTPSNFNNAYYCPFDPPPPGQGRGYVDPNGTIVIPLQTMIRVQNGDIFGRGLSAKAGDFAVALVAAHEFGHHIVDELEVQHGVRTANRLTGKNSELIADCLAGMWTNTAYYKGYLEDGDFQEGLAALDKLGDTVVTRDPHGTPQERRAAFLVGYNAGSLDQCVSRYYRS